MWGGVRPPCFSARTGRDWEVRLISACQREKFSLTMSQPSLKFAAIKTTLSHKLDFFLSFLLTLPKCLPATACKRHRRGNSDIPQPKNRHYTALSLNSAIASCWQCIRALWQRVCAACQTRSSQHCPAESLGGSSKVSLHVKLERHSPLQFTWGGKLPGQLRTRWLMSVLPPFF